MSEETTMKEEAIRKAMTRRGWLRLLGVGAAGLLGSARASRAWAEGNGVCALDDAGVLPPGCQQILFPSQSDSPLGIGRNLLAGNRRYAEGRTISHTLASERSLELETGQAPSAMILSCADSRVTPELIFDQPRATLFVCRVAGNFATREIVGSLEYGVKVLGARLLVVLAHSNCGAVSAAISLVHGGAFPPDEFGQIGELAARIAPAVESVIGHPGDLLFNATNANARLNAATLAGLPPILSPGVQDGSLLVVAARYDIGTGEVSVL